MAAIARLKPYAGPALLSYGFRPFFLLGSIWAGLEVLAWLPMFYGELSVATAFSPRDWHVHEMLYGYLPAVITGFLFTAIPNWTGRLPLQDTPLLVLVNVWIAGRLAVTFSAETGWLVAMLIDAGFLLLVATAAAREILAGRNWRNLNVVVLVLLMLAGNVAFHLEAHFHGVADTGIRIGIAVVVLLISLIGGRITPSFTRNWLVRENPGRLPAPFSRFDVIVRRDRCAGTGRLDCRLRQSFHRHSPRDRRIAASGAARPLGRGSNLARAAVADPACRLCLRADRIPAQCSFGLRPRRRQRRHSCLDGGSRGHHDAGGDEPGHARAYRPATDRVRHDASDLCRDHRRGPVADLRGDRARPQRTVAASCGICLGGRLLRIRNIVRAVAGGRRSAQGRAKPRCISLRA